MHNTAMAGAGSQQLQALERANRVRRARAELKRRVAAQEVTVAEVIERAPWEAASMSIGDLLMSQRRWGTARCRRLLNAVGLSENKEIGTLTERQRRLLSEVLRDGRTPPPAPPPERHPSRAKELVAA